MEAQNGGCPFCGEPISDKENLRYTAEWQGGAPVLPLEETPSQSKAEKIRVGAKTLFALAFIGLLLDFVFGVGALLFLPVAIVASVYQAQLYRLEQKVNARLVWAIVVGFFGVLFGVPFFIFVL